MWLEKNNKLIQRSLCKIVLLKKIWLIEEEMFLKVKSILDKPFEKMTNWDKQSLIIYIAEIQELKKKYWFKCDIIDKFLKLYFIFKKI
jgi:hypothetical protein